MADYLYQVLKMPEPKAPETLLPLLYWLKVYGPHGKILDLHILLIMDRAF